MISFHTMKASIRGLFVRRHLNQRLDEELQIHIDLLVEEEMHQGVPEAEARRRARLRFGGLDQTRESARDARALRLESFWKDLCYAWKRVCSTPLFSLFAVTTLALGIGATTAIYSIIRSVLQPPPGVKNIESIINIYHCPEFSGSIPIIGFSYGDYLDLCSRQTLFQDVTAWRFFRASFTTDVQAGTAWSEIVDGGYFNVLGVSAQLGRTLQHDDDKPSASPVVVISHSMWQSIFQGRSDVIGRFLKVNGRIYEIVGVAPAGFNGLSGGGMVRSALWVPLGNNTHLFSELHIGSLDPNDREGRSLLVKGLLKPGRTVTEAAVDVAMIGKQLDLSYPIGRDLPSSGSGGWHLPSYNMNRQWSVRRAADIKVDDTLDAVIGPVAWTIMTAVVLVLLIACSNIANLMLARASGRRHDLAIRLALGASRSNLVRSLLAESGILAFAGGVVGIGIARIVIVLLGNDIEVLSGLILHFEPRLDFAALFIAAFAAMLSLIVAGLVPALQSTREDLRSALATDASPGTRPRWRGRRILIAAQVTVSVLLLSITALYVDDVRRQSYHNSGLELERLALAEVDFTAQGYEEARVRQIANVVLEQMERRPDVDAAAVSSGLPVGVTTPGCMLESPGTKRWVTASFVAGTPGIFRTLGVHIVRGRAFDNSAANGSDQVIVVNETTARQLFGTIDAVGREFKLVRSRWVGEKEHPMETMRIIGVAADSDSGSVGQRTSGVVYLPFDQHYEGRLVFSVRARNNSEMLVGALRRTLRSIDSEAAIIQAGTGSAIAGPSVVYAQIMAGIAGTLGCLALVLALAGLYGVLSHVVSRRTWEIGVRMTLGARRSGVIRMVLWDGLRPVVLGILIGSIVGIAAQKLIRPQFRPLAELLPPQNIAVLVAVPLLLLVVASIACLLPARRAASINPNSALREL
jgi:predicted permease